MGTFLLHPINRHSCHAARQSLDLHRNAMKAHRTSRNPTLECEARSASWIPYRASAALRLARNDDSTVVGVTL